MHDVLRQRLLRKLESLPEDQIYQVLDYIEFLESKYSGEVPEEGSGLQRFAEKLEDRMRKKAVSPTTLREAFQVIAAADRVLSSVSSAGKQLLSELNGPGAGEPGTPPPGKSSPPSEGRPPPVGGGYRPRKKPAESPPADVSGPGGDSEDTGDG